MSNTKERTAFDLTSLQLKAKPAQGSKRPAGLSVKSWNNKPSLTVFTNVDGLPRNGIIGFNVYPFIFMTFLQGLEEIADMPFEEGTKVTRKIAIFDKPTQDRQHIGDLAFGRSPDGIMYIMLVSNDQSFPKIPFMMQMPRQYEYEGLSPQEASRSYCKGCIAWWRATMPKHILENFVDETKNQQGGGFGGGGYGNNRGGNNNRSGYNNGGGGYGSSSSSDVSDDDLAF